MVGVRHVLAGELRDGVRPARLADRADRRDLALADVVGVGAEDLARREVDEALERVDASRARPRARCRCRSRSRASSAPGSRARSRRRRSRRSGRSASRRAASSFSRSPSRTSPWWSVKFGWSASVGARERVAVEVVDRDDLVVVDELARERRRDEAGAAGDEDPLALEHAPSVTTPIVPTDGHGSRRPAPRPTPLRGVSAVPAGGGLPGAARRSAEPLARAQRAFNDAALRLDRRALGAIDEAAARAARGGAPQPRARGAAAPARAARARGGPRRSRPSRGRTRLPDYFAFEATDAGADRGGDASGSGPTSSCSRGTRRCSISAAAAASCSSSCARPGSTRAASTPTPTWSPSRAARASQVEQADALGALEAADDGSLGAMTALQLVEHLPPAAARRASSSGRARSCGPAALLVLETINPVSPAALRNYFADLTHAQPLVAETLELLVREAGFGERRGAAT